MASKFFWTRQGRSVPRAIRSFCRYQAVAEFVRAVRSNPLEALDGAHGALRNAPLAGLRAAELSDWRRILSVERLAAMNFKDHFSVQAQDYALFRPDYPPELFANLAAALPADRRNLAWDCATGNGQAAAGLAPYFERVIASDASAKQIQSARSLPNVVFQVFPAEAPLIADGSADLITVAQALHWFDLDRFYAAVRRAARPGALLAVWGYGAHRAGADLDALLDRFYHDIVGPYWPPERAHIDSAYASLDFPFPSVPVSAPPLERAMNLPQFLGYLGTWSAVQRYMQERRRDPRDEIAGELAGLWGAPTQERNVVWRFFMRVGRVER